MNKNNQSVSSEKAFTLIEILVAIAIIAILSTVTLVSLSSFRSKARAAKSLAQLSSAIPSMISCWGSGNVVNNPQDDGGAICKAPGMLGADIDSYGFYPDLSGGDLESFSYGQIDMTKGSWHFGAQSATDKKAICCNMTLNACQEVEEPLADTNCEDTIPSN